MFGFSIDKFGIILFLMPGLIIKAIQLFYANYIVKKPSSTTWFYLGSTT